MTDTNTTALGFVKEATAGTKVTTGLQRIEPNDIGSFAPTIATVARDPISDKLQRQKGTTTDLDAALSFPTDLTMSSFLNWIEPVVFAEFVNGDVRGLGVASCATSNDQYTLSANLVAAQNAKLQDDALVWFNGFVNDANNGLKSLDSDTTTDKIVGVSENLVDETAPAGTKMYFAGHRISGGSGTRTWQYTTSSRTAELNFTGLGTTLQDADGLRVGMVVHFGSVAEAGGSLQNGIRTSANSAMAGDTGYARLISRSANVLTFDRVSKDLQKTTAVDISGVNVDMVFGDFLKNVARTATGYLDRTHTVLLGSPTLFGTGSADSGLEYAVGARVGTLTINLPVTSKATMDVSMIANDVEAPTQGTIPTLTDPDFTTAFNTTSDIARIRMNADADGIDTDFTALTITINPQLTAEKVLGTLGARSIARGNLLVDVAAEVFFSSDLIPKSIRNNTTMAFDTKIANNDGVIAIDVPAMTIGDGSRTYPRNQRVRINAAGQSVADDDFDASILVSIMPVPLPAGQ